MLVDTLHIDTIINNPTGYDKSNLRLLCPEIDYYVNKLKSKEHFINLKIQHGFFDQLLKLHAGSLITQGQFNPKYIMNKNNIDNIIYKLYKNRPEVHGKVRKQPFYDITTGLFEYFFSKDTNYAQLGVSPTAGGIMNKNATPNLHQCFHPLRNLIIKDLCEKSYRDMFLMVVYFDLIRLTILYYHF